MMNKSALAKLKRTALQQLAKRGGVRANAKSTDIIDILLKKFPHGVPRSLLQSSERQEQSTTRNEPKRRKLNIDSQTPDVTTNTGLGKHGIQSNLVEHNPGSDPFPHAPGDKSVRLVKREITRLIDEEVAIREAVYETELLMAQAMSIANEIAKDIREISWMRYCIETDVVYELKHDQALWDGTRLMSDEDERQQRETLLKDTNREGCGGV
ncbi:hypothetical protein BDZ94DRAFT_1243682 [Collybia nuda]|uniref:Uncharacterized protein n=1 Tax=Collybia nuda TaxID=64659 RepID=A0A9P5YHG2_9AGAR|nr:hypothetical protein BDZ94DRAFT_1243682 [Collybia nuda]